MSKLSISHSFVSCSNTPCPHTAHPADSPQAVSQSSADHPKVVHATAVRSALASATIVRHLSVLSLCLSAFACGDSTSTIDAGPLDAADDVTDTGTGIDAVSDARVVESCDDEGATRVGVCGMCGTQSETCTAGEWAPQSECLNQGECAVGAVETEDTAACGQRQRICLDGCMWGAWSTVVEDGPCSPGEVFEDDPNGCGEGVSADTVCNDSCAFELVDESQCTDACGPRVAYPHFEERVCIPEGETHIFYYDRSGREPVVASRNPTLSTFQIDRYPVTEARYQACIDAGECPPMADPPRGENFAAIVRAEGSYRYCDFVGASLPTLAQVWRAARGDCEFAASFAWSECAAGVFPGGDDCASVVSCASECASEANSYCSPVDTTPASAGVFPVEYFPGRGPQSEWVRDEVAASEAGLGEEYDGHDPTLLPDEARGGSAFFEFVVGRNTGSNLAVRGSFRCVWEVR